MKNTNEALAGLMGEVSAKKEIVEKYPELNHLTDLLIEQGMLNEKIAELTTERNKLDRNIDQQERVELGAQISSLDDQLINLEKEIEGEYLRIRIELDKELPPLADILRAFRKASNDKQIEMPDKDTVMKN